jgi:hypothetical protein
LELRLRLELWLWLWLGWWRRPVSRRERSGGRRRLRRRRILPDVDGLARWQQRFLGHVDDRDFLLAGFRFLRLVLSYGGDPVAGHPVRGRALAVSDAVGWPIGQRSRRFPVQRLEGRTMFEVGVEQDLQVGPQCRQLGP